MNIYDFDETIYDSDSTKDFYFYCLKRYPAILLTVPYMAWGFFLYVIGAVEKTRAKEIMYRFLHHIPDIDAELERFWDINERKIKPWYRERQREDDIIISASPEFLLSPICNRLGIKYLMASRVDKKTGKYTGENCWGEEKVKRLYEVFPDSKCEEFYSDSLSDTPLAKIADKAMIIRGEKLIQWKEYKKPKWKMFLSREFLSFLIIGVINTFSNAVFSIGYLWILKKLFAGQSPQWYTNIAFYPGYLTANILAYILNSKLTFKEKKLTFVKYVKFFLSYIPNFVIQKLIVKLFTMLVSGYSFIAYAIAAIIGVPITFVFMKIFAFRKKDNKKE